jgi:PKD repeat protein
LSKQGKNIDIDDLFRMKLDDYPVEPGAGVRSHLMKRVARREFLRFNPVRMNVWYAAAAATVVTVALSLVLRVNPESDMLTEQVGQPDTFIIHDDSPAQVTTDNKTAAKAVKSGRAEGTNETGTPVRDIKAEKSGSDQKTEMASGRVAPDLAAIKQGTTNSATELSVDNKTSAAAPLCSFSVSQVTGCAPLTVTLKNTSPQYKSLKWRSSDGRISADSSPEWTFTTAGKYTVLLTITDESGNQGHSSVELTVFPAPVARFEIVAVKRELSEKEVMLYNYSEGFQTARWDFGDGTYSLQRETEHRYEKAGTYRILLTVTGEEGCTDTVSALFTARTDAFRIQFPNAFIPNPNGPTGGYYSPMSDAAAQVFHPEYEGISEYHLIIRSRTGIVIFESRDVNIGWDGYYRGQLGEPGVYIWQSSGRFTNGEFFQKSGDVTLLRVR